MSGSIPEFCRGALQAGVCLLAQSTLLLALGLTAAWLFRRRGPAFRAFLLQVTIAGVVLGAVASITTAGRVRPVWGVRLPETHAAPGEEPLPSLRSFLAPGHPPRSGVGEEADTESSPIGKEGGAFANVSSFSPAGGGGEPRRAGGVPPPARTPSLYVWLFGLWAGGTGLLLLWLAACGGHLARLRRDSMVITDGPAFTELERTAAALSVRPPYLVAGSGVRSPFLAGVWRPTIFLPATWETEYDAPTLQVILAHETAHHARRDCAWTLLLRLTCAALWPQPLLWLLARQLEQASEEACDLLALMPDCSPRRYADCLLALAGRTLPSPIERAVGAGVVPVRSSVGRRIQQVLRQPKMRPLTLRRRLTTLAIFGVTLLGAFTLFGAPPADVPVASFDWAKQQGWMVQPIEAVSDDSLSGIGKRLALRLHGQAPSAQDAALTRQCDKARDDAGSIMPFVKGQIVLRNRLRQLLARNPHFFYAEYLMANSYSATGDSRQAAPWIGESLRDAPAVLAERCIDSQGQPVPGFRIGYRVGCEAPIGFHANAGCWLDLSAVTDQEGCFYLPVFRGLYSAPGFSYSPLKGRAVNLPTFPALFAINSHVGILPPIKVVSAISMNPPFDGAAYTDFHPLLVEGPNLRLSWKPYPGAVKYAVVIQENRPGGSGMILPAYDGDDSDQSTATETILGLHDNYPGFYRDCEYLVTITALDDRGKTISRSNTYSFVPADGLAAQPLTHKVIQDALGQGAHVTAIQRQGQTLVVTGTVPKSNPLTEHDEGPGIERQYVADVSRWKLGKPVSPGIFPFRMTIALPPMARLRLSGVSARRGNLAALERARDQAMIQLRVAQRSAEKLEQSAHSRYDDIMVAPNPPGSLKYQQLQEEIADARAALNAASLDQGPEGSQREQAQARLNALIRARDELMKQMYTTGRVSPGDAQLLARAHAERADAARAQATIHALNAQIQALQ